MSRARRVDRESLTVEELHGKAERRVRAAKRGNAAGKRGGAAKPDNAAGADPCALLHELQVHQIELQMQNEELLRAQAAVSEVSEKYFEFFDLAPVGYFVLDCQGRIEEVNLAGATLAGRSREALAGKQLAQVMPMSDRNTFLGFCDRVLAGDSRQTCELRLLRDGAPLQVLIEGIAIPDRRGIERLCLASVVDISQRKRADDLAAVNQALTAEIAARRQVELALREREEQVMQRNRELEATVCQLRRTEEALVEAKSAAEAANTAKSRFLASMSHELRTPMNAILGLIDVALARALEPMVSDCLQTARGSADLLLTLLNDLLDSAKIDAGKLELETVPFSLRRMLDQVSRILGARAEEKGMRFACRMEEENWDAFIGDRLKLQQILLNLAGNAIKFTDHGEVEVRVRALRSPAADPSPCRERTPRRSETDTLRPHPIPLAAGEETLLPAAPSDEAESVELEFTVRDTGIGIPATSQEQLFQPFVQGDASVARRYGGSGLGLSICKKLVELMGGRIWAESEPGKGSTFFFTVRLSPAKELPAEFKAPLDIVETARAPLRILLAEDNPANQKVAVYFLHDRGHKVDIAGDGQEAVYMADQTPYDVILMDVQMPEMDGLTATAALRNREAGGKRTPIIAMTAYSMQGDRERCLAAGADAYISKPVRRDELIAAVEQWSARTERAAPAAAYPRRLTANRRPAPEEDADRPLPRLGNADHSADPPAFDMETAMLRLGGQKGIFRAMVAYFFDDGMKILAEIRSAAAAADARTLENKAHLLKGTVLYLGAEAASEAISAVETLARTGDLAGATRKLDDVNPELARLADALRPYRPDPAA